MNDQNQISFLREPQLLSLTTLSRSTRWRMERQGQFPKKRRLSGRTVGWLSSEIEDWMKSRALVNSINTEGKR